jgi:MFS family permease
VNTEHAAYAAVQRNDRMSDNTADCVAVSAADSGLPGGAVTDAADSPAPDGAGLNGASPDGVGAVDGATPDGVGAVPGAALDGAAPEGVGVALGAVPPESGPPVVAPAAGGHRVTYRDIFAVRAYRYLFWANLLSQSGDQLTKVALAALVLQRTGSATLTAITYAVTYLPWVLGGPLLSTYADRLPRRQVLVACDAARVGLVLLLATPNMPTPALIAVLFGANLLASPFNAAQAALMPELLAGERYVVANGLDGIVRQVAQVGGFALGGVAVWALTPAGALFADAGTFAASALLVLRGVPAVPAALRREDGERQSLLRDMLDGARVVFDDRRLRAYVLMFWAAASFTFAYEAIAMPYAAQFAGGPRTGGLLLAAGPLGETLGIIFLGRVVSARIRMRLLLPLAVLSTAALIPTLIVRSLPLVLLLLVLAGFGVAFNIPLNSLFGRAVPSQYRGRAFGLAGAGMSLSYGLTMLAAGAATDLPAITPGTVIGCSGIIGTALVLTLTRIWPRDDFHRGR